MSLLGTFVANESVETRDEKVDLRTRSSAEIALIYFCHFLYCLLVSQVELTSFFVRQSKSLCLNKHLVDHAIFLGFGCSHPVVTVAILIDLLDRLL